MVICDVWQCSKSFQDVSSLFECDECNKMLKCWWASCQAGIDQESGICALGLHKIWAEKNLINYCHFTRCSLVGVTCDSIQFKNYLWCVTWTLGQNGTVIIGLSITAGAQRAFCFFLAVLSGVWIGLFLYLVPCLLSKHKHGVKHSPSPIYLGRQVSCSFLAMTKSIMGSYICHNNRPHSKDGFPLQTDIVESSSPQSNNFLLYSFMDEWKPSCFLANASIKKSTKNQDVMCKVVKGMYLNGILKADIRKNRKWK